MKYLQILATLLLFPLVSSCSGLRGSDIPTPIPADYLPTAIALTMQASQPTLVKSASTPRPEELPGVVDTVQAPTPTFTIFPTATLSPTLISSSTPTLNNLPGTVTQTPPADVPIAAIQIFKPGDLSKISSPLQVSAYLKPGAEGRVRIELFGEDGRLLVRQIKVLYALPNARINLLEDLDFEIEAVAEVGRLVLSVDDEAGRTVALNSVDLILLSMGEADISPASATQETIVIREPVLKALIQGGVVSVSGLARPSTGGPLVAQLVDEQGKVVGMRLAAVTPSPDGGYGYFSAEVPYEVSALTPVRLMVYEDGETISGMKYLSSVEILVSP